MFPSPQFVSINNGLSSQRQQNNFIRVCSVAVSIPQPPERSRRSPFRLLSVPIHRMIGLIQRLTLERLCAGQGHLEAPRNGSLMVCIRMLV